jgi:hypothetical protein
MSDTFGIVRALVARGEIRVSAHGYDELASDEIPVKDILVGIERGAVVENYPDFAKGPCVLVLQLDLEGRAIHVLWGVEKGKSTPAVLITAYRPDPGRWSADFKRRIK